jgi:hypothetical protein
MGLRDDDEELFISQSSEDVFQNPEKAKSEAREQKPKSEGKLLDLKKQMLKNQLNEKSGSSDAAADAETKRLKKLREDEEKSETFGTKTHMQMEETETLDAQTELTAEQFQEMEHEEEQKKDQAGQEYAGEEA